MQEIKVPVTLTDKPERVVHTNLNHNKRGSRIEKPTASSPSNKKENLESNKGVCSANTDLSA